MQRGQNPGQSAKPEYVLKRANGSFVVNYSIEMMELNNSYNPFTAAIFLMLVSIILC